MPPRKTKTPSRNPGLTSKGMLADIQSGTIHPVYYFYGPEDFEQDALIRALIEKVVEPSARLFNLDLYQSEDMDISEAVNQVLTFPMMSTRRIVVIKRVEKLNDSAASSLIPLIENPVDSTVLVLTATKPDGRKKLFSLLRAQACALEFRTLYDNEVPRWIQNRAAFLECEMEPEAAHLLHLSIGGNLRELNSELEKLKASTTGNRITRDDVAHVVATTRGVTVFELANHVGKKNLTQAQQALDSMLAQGESSVGIVVTLTRHFSLLRKAKWLSGQQLPKPEIASLLKVPPFFVGSYLDQARNFDDRELWSSFEVLLKADNRLKSSSRSDRVILSELVYCLCRGTKP